VVFNNKVSKKPAELDYAELLDSPDTIIRYLLKEAKVRETLKYMVDIQANLRLIASVIDVA